MLCALIPPPCQASYCTILPYSGIHILTYSPTYPLIPLYAIPLYLLPPSIPLHLPYTHIPLFAILYAPYCTIAINYSNIRNHTHTLYTQNSTHKLHTRAHTHTVLKLAASSDPTDPLSKKLVYTRIRTYTHDTHTTKHTQLHTQLHTHNCTQSNYTHTTLHIPTETRCNVKVSVDSAPQVRVLFEHTYYIHTHTHSHTRTHSLNTHIIHTYTHSIYIYTHTNSLSLSFSFTLIHIYLCVYYFYIYTLMYYYVFVWAGHFRRCVCESPSHIRGCTLRTIDHEGTHTAYYAYGHIYTRMHTHYIHSKHTSYTHTPPPR